jgi:hypothetical protein
MPSIGEFPLVNVICADCGPNQNDFDGFVFTDPTNPDTDSDGTTDGLDNEPLINPRSFGTESFAINFGNRTDRDGDNDGLGNGMDLGDDDESFAGNRGVLDNPTDLRRVLEQFRRDLLQTNLRVSEALIEDLLSADWNGDGLFRLTDIRVPHFGNEPAGRPIGFFADGPAGPVDLFVGADAAASTLGFANTAFPDSHVFTDYYHAARRGATRLPLGFQELLRPVRANENIFLPDPRIWTVLYAWRTPGFDVDGNGFIGYDSDSLEAQQLFLNGGCFAGADTQTLSACAPGDPPSPTNPASSVAIAESGFSPGIDGQIEVSGGASSFCAAFGLGFGSAGALLGLIGGRVFSFGARRRRSDA